MSVPWLNVFYLFYFKLIPRQIFPLLTENFIITMKTQVMSYKTKDLKFQDITIRIIEIAAIRSLVCVKIRDRTNFVLIFLTLKQTSLFSFLHWRKMKLLSNLPKSYNNWQIKYQDPCLQDTEVHNFSSIIHYFQPKIQNYLITLLSRNNVEKNQSSDKCLKGRYTVMTFKKFTLELTKALSLFAYQ